MPTRQVNNFFGDYFWLAAYSKLLANNSLFIVAFYKDNKLKSIAPFQRNGTTLISLCDHKTDYNTIFIGEEFDLCSFLDFLRSQGISEIFLKNIIKEHEAFIPDYVQRQKTFCPSICLKEESQATNKFKGEITFAMRKIKCLGEIEHEIISITPDLINLFLHLHKTWWNSKSQTGLFNSDTEKRFLSEILIEFNSRQQSFFSIFYANKEIASILLLFKLNDKRIGYYFGGHNLKFKKFQIGLLHIDTLIKYLSFNSDYLSFDFLRGEEKYKYQFGATKDNYVFNCRLSTNSKFLINA